MYPALIQLLDFVSWCFLSGFESIWPVCIKIFLLSQYLSLHSFWGYTCLCITPLCSFLQFAFFPLHALVQIFSSDQFSCLLILIFCVNSAVKPIHCVLHFNYYTTFSSKISILWVFIDLSSLVKFSILLSVLLNILITF